MAEAIAAEQDNLEEMAQREAGLQIERARAEFQQSEAARMFLAAEIERRREADLPSMIELELAVLQGQALDAMKREALEAAPLYLAESDPRRDYRWNEERAKGIRRTTEVTKVLSFSQLMQGDKVNLILKSADSEATDKRSMLMRFEGDSTFAILNDSNPLDSNPLHPMTLVDVETKDPRAHVDGMIQGLAVGISPEINLHGSENSSIWPRSHNSGPALVTSLWLDSHLILS